MLKIVVNLPRAVVELKEYVSFGEDRRRKYLIIRGQALQSMEGDSCDRVFRLRSINGELTKLDSLSETIVYVPAMLRPNHEHSGEGLWAVEKEG